MIKIFVSCRELELPTDISFEYTAENRLFSNADGYSLDIEIPLRESKVNSEIFGHIWRKDADVENMRFDAQLWTENMTFYGIVAIVSVNESTLSIQFLEGRSAQNFEKDFEDRYINELKIEKFIVPIWGHTEPVYWKSFDEGAEAVPLPYCNEDNDNAIVHNEVYYTGGNYHLSGLGNRSYMPYLPVLLRKICDALGYKCDIRSIERSKFKDIVVCNTLPATEHGLDYTAALPHWTINEFFEKLEIILGGEFNINHTDKEISFEFTHDAINSAGTVSIDDVVDEYTAEIDSLNDEAPDIEILKNIAYKDNKSRYWKLQSCDWFKRQRVGNEGWVMPGTDFGVDDDGNPYYGGDPSKYINIAEFDTMQNLIDYFKSYDFQPEDSYVIQRSIYYVREAECFFIFHKVDYRCDIVAPTIVWNHDYELMPVNSFGNYIVNPDSDNTIELDTVPVPINPAKKCVFLSYTNTDETNDNEDDADYSQPEIYKAIANGESKKPEYFDKLYIGFFPGYQNFHNQIGLRPVTSNIEMFDRMSCYQFPDYSLRLNCGFSRGIDRYKDIDAKKLYKFSFMSDTLPSPRAAYIIKGKKYVCAKLTTEFSATGMSHLIKGEFYRY